MSKVDPAAARKRMLIDLVKAIYPVLIPIEEASVQVQIENHKIIVKCAEAALDTFIQEKY